MPSKFRLASQSCAQYNFGVPDALPSPELLIEALASVGQALPAAQADRLAAEIEACGSVEAACDALADDGDHELLPVLLAFRAALRERADPSLRPARLLREARDIEARAEPFWREAAEFAGKAAARRLRGEAALAAAFEQRAAAAERLAAALEAQALQHRLEAAQLQASAARSHEFLSLLQSLAA